MSKIVKMLQLNKLGVELGSGEFTPTGMFYKDGKLVDYTLDEEDRQEPSCEYLVGACAYGYYLYFIWHGGIICVGNNEDIAVWKSPMGVVEWLTIFKPELDKAGWYECGPLTGGKDLADFGPREQYTDQYQFSYWPGEFNNDYHCMMCETWHRLHIRRMSENFRVALSMANDGTLAVVVDPYPYPTWTKYAPLGIFVEFEYI